MNGLVCKRYCIGRLVRGIEWDVSDQTVKIVGGVRRMKFHFHSWLELNGVIVLTTLKIEKDTPVILETKLGARVQGCVHLEGTKGVCMLIVLVIEQHTVGFVVATNGNALHHAKNVSLTFVGKVASSKETE